MVLNLGLLAFKNLPIIRFRPWLGRMHGRFFNLPEDYVNKMLYAFIGCYKILVIVLNVVPWLAIQINANSNFSKP